MTPRLGIWRSARATAGVYVALAPLLLPASLIIYIPLGLLDALGDHFDHVKVEKLDFFTGLLLVGALGQFAAAALGDVFYSGFVAAAVLARTGKRRHPLVEIVLKLPYRRLIVADLILTIGTTVGLAFLIVPGVVFFVWFGLAAPLIKIEGLGVWGAFRRSRRLVRGSFWPVLMLLGGLYLLSNSITSSAQDLAATAIGHKLLADWAAALAIGVAVEPIVAVATVVVTLELIELHRAGPAQKRGRLKIGAPSPKITSRE